jgi:acyl transferase domain-containing protein
MEKTAIIGISCRFPGAENPESFWSLLWNGADAIGEIPKDRWDASRFYDPEPGRPGKMITRCGGFLDRIDQFDADFFDIDPREAKRLDPQQRLMLEVAWEALEDAGLVPEKLAGTQTGVFLGIRQTDYGRYLYGELARIDGRNPDNTYPCIVANRISYVLDLRGPSMAVDTACSSSLVSVHLACQSLRAGESDLAVAGGVNLNLFPEEIVSRSLAGMVSPSGRCRAFDATADGYVIGDGCGAVVLKRLGDALRDGDNILAVIAGSATNHNGLSYKLTAYNGLSQEALLRKALEGAGAAAEDVGFIEANGTGSMLGDPIELKAIKSVYGRDAASTLAPCWISCVKTNIGHLEGAAGIASLIKVVLCLQHEGVAPHLHLRELNPQVSLEDAGLAIAVKPQRWPRGRKKRLAGLSAFGLGGANAHMILEEAPLPVPRPQAIDRPRHILTLSAKSERALRELAQRYLATLTARPDLLLADLCFTANTGRSHFRHRLAITAGTNAELRDRLGAFVAAADGNDHFIMAKVGRKQPKLVFVFPGQGTGFRRAGQELYATQPAFRRAFDRCAQVIRARSGIVLSPAPGESAPEDARAEHIEPVALFTLQYALAELWKSWGLTPATTIGEGVGEEAAACVAGACSLEETLSALAENSSRAVDAGAGRTPDGEHALGLAPAVERAVLDGSEILLEIGPAPLRRDIFAGPDSGSVLWLPSLEADSLNWDRVLRSLGELYVRGAPVDWIGFDRDYARRRIQAPTYPFQRQSFVFDQTSPGQPIEMPLSQEIHTLIAGLLEDGGVARLSELYGKDGNISHQETLRRQVRSLRIEQASDLLNRVVQLARDREGDGSDRLYLKRKVESLESAQVRRLLIEAIELLWRREELLASYLERKVSDGDAQHWDLEQMRTALIYLSGLLRRRNLNLDNHGE